MLKIRNIVLFLAIFLALIADSLAKPRRHVHPSNPPAQSQQSANPDQRGTEQSPLIVKVIPTPQTPEEANHLAAQEADKSAADWWLVKLTAILAAVGVLQLIVFGWVFGWQGIQLQRTVRASRDEFLATHRPKIRVKHLWLTSDISQQTPIRIKMVCVNTGTANATLREIGIRCHVFGNEYLLPANPAIDATLFPTGSLPSGVNWTIPDFDPNSNINTGRVLAAHEWDDIQRGHAKLYCVGWVSYIDDAKRLRITGFCRVLEPPDGHTIITTDNGRFRVCKHPDYEYQD